MPTKGKDRQIEVWVTPLVEDEDRISRAQRRELRSRTSRRSYPLEDYLLDEEEDEGEGADENDEDAEIVRRLLGRGSALRRKPFASQQARPVIVDAPQVQDEVRKMAKFLAVIADGARLPGVRPDSVSFSFTVGTDGAVKWIMGAKVEGSASITFKFDAVPSSASAT